MSYRQQKYRIFSASIRHLTRFLPDAAAPDSNNGTDVAYIQLSGLSVREEADRSGSYSVKPRLEGVDGRRVDDLLQPACGRRFRLSVTRSEKKWRLLGLADICSS